jgi:secretion/DNA translocation related CpaE-like protein
VSASRATSIRPLVVSTDDGLVDDLLRLLAAAGAEAELATGGPALRRGHRDAPLVLVGADALGSGGLRSLPRRPGLVVVATGELPAAEWARAVELGAERVAVLPADESWLLARVAAAVRSPVERGWLVAVGGCCGGAGASTVATAVALAAAPDVLLVDGDPWGGGLDLVLGAERADGLRWPDLAGLRGRVSGDALLAALPEIGGVHVLAHSRDDPGPAPDDAVLAVTEAARSAGCPVVVDLSRGAPGGASAVLGEADLAVLVVPGRLRAATAARLLVDAPGSLWSAAHVVVGRIPGGLSCADVADLVGRPVVAELAHDRSAAPRGERGQPPEVGVRSPLGGVARRILTVVRSGAAGRAGTGVR